MTVKAVSEQVSSPHLGQNSGQRQRRPGGMDHQRQPGRFGRFPGQLQGGKLVAAVGGQVGAETYLDSQDHVPIGFHGFQRRADTAVAQILQFAHGGIGLNTGDHAYRRDIQQGKEPGGADFDDVAAENRPRWLRRPSRHPLPW